MPGTVISRLGPKGRPRRSRRPGAPPFRGQSGQAVSMPTTQGAPSPFISANGFILLGSSSAATSQNIGLFRWVVTSNRMLGPVVGPQPQIHINGCKRAHVPITRRVLGDSATPPKSRRGRGNMPMRAPSGRFRRGGNGGGWRGGPSKSEGTRGLRRYRFIHTQGEISSCRG